MTTHPSRPAAQRGLSLIELCATVAIAAVLTGAAAPSLSDFIAARRLEGHAAQLATDLQFVRTEAVARNQPVRLAFATDAGGSCYVAHTGSAAQCTCTSTGPTECSGDAVEIKTVQLPQREQVGLLFNAASIVFDPLHGTSSPTATLRVLGARGRAIHHVVNVMGRVRSCSPQPTLPGYRAC